MPKIIDKEHADILKLFNNRCIRCGKKTNIVHEVIPRSAGIVSMKTDNRVPLCGVCHDWAHNLGNKNSGEILLALRGKRLEKWLKI